jgi:hypothetical protein
MITHLHTYFHFPVSLPGALAGLKSPEGAVAPIGEKKSKWRDKSVQDNWGFWKDNNRCLSTYFGFPMSFQTPLPG